MNLPPKLEDALRPDGAPKIVFEYGHQGFLNAVATEFPVIETADLDFLEIAEQATRPAPLAIVIFNEPLIERGELFERLEAATNVSGASGRLQAAVDAVRACKQRIADLEAAKGEAEAQRSANEQRTKAAEHAARLAAFSKELKACDEDALAVQDLLETLAARWASLLKHRNTAHNVAQQRLDGLLFDAHSLERAFQLCVDRVNVRTEERQRLPGGLAAKAIINPNDVALGLTERLRQANARALEIVEGTRT